MMLAPEDICTIVEMVVKEMTDVSVEPSDPLPRPPNLTGYEVAISGAFNGKISIEAASTTALELASSMLSIELAETTEDDMLEVMGELTNMVGGNIKSLLPGPSSLSIPQRMSQREVTPQLGPDQSQAIVVRCGDRPMWITLSKS